MDTPSPRPGMTGSSPVSALGPLVERIDHVGLAVADLDVAIAFYARAFGLHSCTRRSTRSRVCARR